MSFQTIMMYLEDNADSEDKAVTIRHIVADKDWFTQRKLNPLNRQSVSHSFKNPKKLKIYGINSKCVKAKINRGTYYCIGIKRVFWIEKFKYKNI